MGKRTRSRGVASVSPLLAAAVDPRRLLRRRPEDGLEDGNVLLEEDGRDGEVPLQLVGAPAEVLRQAGHVLPLLDLVEELNQAAGQEREVSVCWTGGLIMMLADVSCTVQVSAQVCCTSSRRTAGSWLERRSSPPRSPSPPWAPRTCRPRRGRRPASVARCPAPEQRPGRQGESVSVCVCLCLLKLSPHFVIIFT